MSSMENWKDIIQTLQCQQLKLIEVQQSVEMKVGELVESMKTIDVISKQYCHSVEAMQDKVLQFEPLYLSWNSGEVVTWFENVDRGILNKSEPFLKFKTQLIANGVTGSDLRNFNDLFLRMLGIGNKSDRAIIMRHLNRLFAHSEQ